MMAKRAKPEEIIAKLREIEVRLSQGESVGKAVKSIGVTEQTYYRWRKEYGGLQVNQAKRLKDMEKENARLRKAISDLMLDKQILEEVIKDPKGSAAKSSKPLAQAPSSQTRER
jgi:transposase-like protein